MDPTIMQLLQMYQASHHGQMYPGISQPSGMFGSQGQLPAMQQPQMGQPQLPPMGAPQGQGDPNAQPQHHHSLSPLTALSPLGGLLASGGGFGKAGLMALSPAFGLANLFGAFK